MKYLFSLAAAVALVAAPPAFGRSQTPQVSMKTARAKAMTIVPHGHIKSAELEKENGKLIYSFDIQTPGKPGVDEVQISAVTGKLVSLKHESTATERKEAQADAKAQKRR